ncbi:hypothetical protein E2C01_040708 [Portunus trituberculatus]|uniref:Uncharacterized protein n=1 Tax=Portunus trituberculatus TaxID=210409 RepID=A0A5B7FNC1_PORTR|nr:hypothetical protein [Portunus trituberculatus]
MKEEKRKEKEEKEEEKVRHKSVASCKTKPGTREIEVEERKHEQSGIMGAKHVRRKRRKLNGNLRKTDNNLTALLDASLANSQTISA